MAVILECELSATIHAAPNARTARGEAECTQGGRTVPTQTETSPHNTGCVQWPVSVVCGGWGQGTGTGNQPSDKKQGILVSEDQSHKSCRFQSALGREKDRAQMVGVI